MRLSLPAGGRSDAAPESRGRWLVRHVIVVWLLVVEPASLALTLDRALPRLPTFGVTGWTVVGVRIALAGIGIAIARRLSTREHGAWRAVSWWAAASIGATLLARAWPELPTGLAPSEARFVALAAVGRDAALALIAAWLARADAAADTERAATGDSS
jgi:hypothetical protein